MQQVRSYKMEKYTYETIETDLGKILLRSDGASIPFDEANSDYQRLQIPLLITATSSSWHYVIDAVCLLHTTHLANITVSLQNA